MADNIGINLPPSGTVPMIAPDGTVADVPHESVNTAVGRGAKLGVDMLSPDGRERATVPVDVAHDALRKGARLAPPPMPAPPVAAGLQGQSQSGLLDAANRTVQS